MFVTQGLTLLVQKAFNLWTEFYPIATGLKVGFFSEAYRWWETCFEIYYLFFLTLLLSFAEMCANLLTSTMQPFFGKCYREVHSHSRYGNNKVVGA